MRLQTLICFYFIEKLGQVLTTPSPPRPTPAGEQFNTECVISYWYMVLLMNAGPSVNPLPDEVDKCSPYNSHEKSHQTPSTPQRRDKFCQFL